MGQRGGKRKGAGRPRKVDEEKANYIFENALKQLYKTTSTDKAKIAFVQKLLKSSRGELFVAEHIFGKPKDNLDITTGGSAFNKPIIDFFKTEDDKDK